MSKLYVNEIKPKTSGNIVTGMTNILEQVQLLCVGDSITVPSGTYTSQNVTAVQNLTTTYADLTGSKITYTPPEGAVAVVYEFNYFMGWGDDHTIAHLKFYVDGTEVTKARHNNSGRFREQYANFRWVIPIGGTADSTTGRQAIWTSSKELKMTGREYSTGNEAKLHQVVYWDGGNGSHIVTPTITLTAIGGAYNG